MEEFNEIINEDQKNKNVNHDTTNEHEIKHDIKKDANDNSNFEELILENKKLSEEKIKCEESIQILTDKLQRLAAIAQNEQRILKEEMEKTKKYTITNFAKNMIDVYDVFLLAIDNIKHEHIEGNKHFQELIDGLGFSLNSFLQALENANIKIIQPKPGDKFDYNLHEILSKVQNKEHSIGTIVTIARQGYMIHDRVLRPSSVIVSSGE